MLPPILSFFLRLKLCHPTLQNSHILHLIVVRLQFGILDIIIGLVVDKVACFQDEGLDVLVLHMYKWAVIKVDVMYIK